MWQKYCIHVYPLHRIILNISTLLSARNRPRSQLPHLPRTQVFDCLFHRADMATMWTFPHLGERKQSHDDKSGKYKGRRCFNLSESRPSFACGAGALLCSEVGSCVNSSSTVMPEGMARLVIAPFTSKNMMQITYIEPCFWTSRLALCLCRPKSPHQPYSSPKSQHVLGDVGTFSVQLPEFVDVFCLIEDAAASPKTFCLSSDVWP